ncbi:MAG: hypothetical protein IT324_17970 [Anaerolineae bacterium]|nr:hypothetical protein [Anaerolineae bacterium]
MRLRLLWLLTIAFCVSLTTNLLPWLRGDIPWLQPDERWVWPYSAPRWLWLIPCALGLAIYVLGALHLLDRADNTTRYPIRLILWSFGGAALIALLLLTLEDRPLYLLFTRSASTVTGGYQYASAMIGNLGDALRDWSGFVQRFRAETLIYGGVSLDPPGLTALYYGTGQVLGGLPVVSEPLGALVRPLECQNLRMMTWSDAQMASAWLQMAMPLWAALAVAPLYRLGVLIFNPRVARWAVALWPLVPGISLFTPRFNVFYPLITLVMLIVLWRGLQRRRLWLIGLAGFIVSVATFLNLSLVPLGLLAGLIILGCTLRNPARLIASLFVFGFGCAIVWAVYGLLSGVSIIDIVSLGLGTHLQNPGLKRPYAPWLILHPYDMFLFVGPPIAILAVGSLLRLRLLSDQARVFAVAGWLTLIVLTLSGTARGETGRVWLFFAPIWILLAADTLQRLSQRECAGVILMQALCVISMAAVLRVHFTALTVPPTVATAEQPAAFPINTPFVRGSDRVTLVGFSFDQPAPNTLALHLHWRADSPVRKPYVLSMVTVPPDKSYRDSLNWNPLNWNYPPSCWQPGQAFVDTVTIPLEVTGKVQPGGWLFSVAISDVFTREPMITTTASGQPDTQVGLGPVQVPVR